ncbi:MAG: hypothetical protein K5669_02430 [Lachnospiraceae bacterium]|nr:hypothetical protein [Lachnospiraceae bacterium]
MNLLNLSFALLILIALPIAAGGGYIIPQSKTLSGDKNSIIEKFIWSWFLGQLLLWCLFQPIAVWCVLKGKDMVTLKAFYLIAIAVAVGVSVIVGTVGALKHRGNKGIATGDYDKDLTDKNTNPLKATSNQEKSKQVISKQEESVKINAYRILWIAVIILIAVQVVLQIVLAYMEVDDSYYVSEATSAVEASRFYNTIPYTGASTDIDFRHGLAPFPLWLAFISSLTGIKAVSIAHVVLPAVHMTMTYMVYAVIGRTLLGDKRRHLPVYMLFVIALNLFGFTSYMTPEKFFMTRIREGKATIASLIIPGIVICLYMILKSLSENKKTDIRLYIMLFALNMSGCLCSTLGALLCALPIFICAVIGAFMLKKVRHLLPMAAGCLPCLIFALMYLKF